MIYKNQLQTPRQASTIYGLDGPSAPRPKNLFYVRFKQASNGASWRRDLGFVVKSLDRPSIQPTIEEVNQYNKKRLIHTGYKTQPIRITMYDTADSMAMQMWNEYSKHYFGDFRHGNNISDYYYDITTDTFNDAANGGYGFAPGNSDDLNGQFFFETIQVFQIFGKQFVQFDLINPKITTFDPDELSYEDSTIATINITLSFEAITYRNDGYPLPVSHEQCLVEAFANKFGGDFLELPQIETNIFGSSVRSDLKDYLPMDYSTTSPKTPTMRSYNSSIGGGILSSYGEFDFGAVSSSENIYPNKTKTFTSDLAYDATSDPTLASLLNISSSRKTYSDTQISSPYTKNKSVDAAQYDVAHGAVMAAARKGSLTALDAPEEIVSGAMAAAKVSSKYKTSREHVGGQTGGGLALSPEAYGMLNATRRPTSQIGINRSRKSD